MRQQDPLFLTLRDGRRLAYAECGDRGGSPAFYFHGTPGSRLEGAFLDAAARRQGVRLIAVDRPGYGHSDYKRGRRLTDWADDVADAADALDLKRFAVIGLSGGGPHAQACAARMPERITSASIVSGAGSPESVLDGRGRFGRFFARLALMLTPLFAFFAAMWAAFWAPRTRAWMMPRFIDRNIMRRKEAREAFVDDVKEALRQGGGAMRQDLVMFARRWGFEPAAVGHVPVRLWHGEADRVVPVAIGRYYAREIPGCLATFFPGEEHLMLIDHADDIMRAVSQMARAAH
jgi:pimeloyl-ACP methyl ester carboxylesterase